MESFNAKTGMAGKDWLEIMAANPGFDVYYCNPFPANEALYHAFMYAHWGRVLLVTLYAVLAWWVAQRVFERRE